MNKKIDIKRKTNIRLEDATQAVIAVVKSYAQTHPGAELTKGEIIKRAIGRAPGIIEDHYDPLYDEWAIPEPDERYFQSKWSDIRKKAAKDYHFWIVQIPRIGFRMGEISDVAKTQPILTRIVIGLVGASQDWAAIILGDGYKELVETVGAKQGTVKELGGIEKYKQLQTPKE